MGTRTILIILSTVLSLSACGNYNDLLKSSDIGYKYEAAKEYYVDGQYNRASQLLQTIITTMKGSEKGQESLYLFGLCNYYSENYETATAIFRKYYQTYAKGVYAEDAHYYSGLSLMQEAPEPRLDQTPTYEAVTEFQNFLELYPYSTRREQAMAHIFELQDLLVEKEYLSAKLYFDLGNYFGNCSNDGGSNYQACVVTAENAIRDYPYTKMREDFAILILRAKFELAKNSVEDKKVERYHNAIDEYYGFTNEYPESKYMKEAEEMFKKASKYTLIETK
jgi:outer membrane protein assembly factor BamD